MTARRVCFAAGAFVLLILGLISGGYIYFAGFGIMAFIVLYTVIINITAYIGLKCTIGISQDKATKGDKIQLILQIHNRLPVIYPLIRIYYEMPDTAVTGKPGVEEISVMPVSRGIIKKEYICAIRGNFNIAIPRIELVDPFGLLNYTMDLTESKHFRQLKLKVYPRILPLTNLPLSDIRQEGILNNQLFGIEEVSIMSDIRQYRFGDQLKRIHWKASSKLNELQVMNYEMTTQPHTIIIMETSPYKMDGLIGRGVEDRIVETTVAVINYILQKWMQLKLITYRIERTEIIGSNPQDFNMIYEFISDIVFDNPFSITQIIQMESAAFNPRDNIILITHELTGELFTRLYALKQSGIYLIVFLILHNMDDSQEDLSIVEKLNRNMIPSYIIYTHEQIDRVAEVL